MGDSEKQPSTKTAVDSVVMRLRDYDNCCDDDVDLAADLLEFFFGQMQAHSVQMDGQHRYRFNSGCWPMTHCVGPSREKAAEAAVQEMRRARNESA